MSTELLPARLLQFGTFEADLRTGELRRSGQRVPLQEQPFQVLCVLLQHAGELVTREELRASVWPEGTFIEFDYGLNTAIKKIRAAIGDEASSPQFVETVPRRGYRFVASVRTVREILPENKNSGRELSSIIPARTPAPCRKGEAQWLFRLAAFVGFCVGYLFGSRAKGNPRSMP